MATERELALVEAALKAAEDIFEQRGGKMVNASWCCEAVRSLDRAAIVASVPQEQAGELLPCPFCGGKAEHHDIGNSYTKSRGTKIWCAECRFSKTVKAIQQSLDWTRSHAIAAWNRRAALSAQEQVEPTPILAAPHSGMRVDYRGLFTQARKELRASPGLAEMLRQFEDHVTELGQRWYAGDAAVVDELLQLYCVEKDSRALLSANQGKK